MIRFFNGKILSLFENETAVRDAEVWVDGGNICMVGTPQGELPSFEREIDLDGDLLIPGFKNAHTHSCMTFLRSFADDLPLDKWLSEQVWPNEAKLSDDAAYVMAKLAIMEYLGSGITASFDMYMHNDSYIKANVDCGFRTVLCGDMNDFDRDYRDLEGKFLRYNGKHELISYRLGFHAEYTTCRERLEFVASLAEKYKAPVFTHLSETKAEVDGCYERNGVSPVRYLSDLGIFNYGGGGFHCVWLNDDDMELFKEKGLFVVLNPASNLKLASGIAPAAEYIRRGIPIALGTDGAGSNNALDMFREMYLAAVLGKYAENDASAVPALSILEAAVSGGAHAMGLYDCDAIAVGKKADLAVINMHKPNMRPLNNIAKNIVYSGSKDNIRLTMVNGKILYENGQYFIGDEPERIYAEAEKIMETIRR